MSIIQMLIAQMFSGEDVGDISHSLRFRGSQYLSRTFGTPTNNLKWTVSTWVKLSSLSSNQTIFSRYESGSNFMRCDFASNSLRLYQYNSAITILIQESPVRRDTSSWLHVVVSYDSANATDSERIKFYVNNVASTSFISNTAPTLNRASIWNVNGGVTHQIGGINGGGDSDGYQSRVCFVDGQALTPSSFGYFNTNINEWVSNSQSQVKAVVDAGGTNSFMLDFDDGTSTTTLGYDKSSKGNNWTCNNISLTAGSTYDWMLDVPGNSYATLNPLDRTLTGGAWSDGNLTFSYSTTGTDNRATIGATNGKYVAQVLVTAISGNINVGLFGTNEPQGSTSARILYRSNGDKVINGAVSAYGASYTVNDVIRIEADYDSGSVEFFKNNVSQGSLSHTLSGGYSFAHTNGAGTTTKWNFGQQPWLNSETPTTGFLALNQANLSASGTVIVSGSFTGNANADGPFVWMNGVPDTLTINGNAVTFGTHADKLANGFKLRTSSASYNVAGSNTWTATITSDTKNIFKYNTAEGNP